jgi:hypothetical protein
MNNSLLIVVWLCSCGRALGRAVPRSTDRQVVAMRPGGLAKDIPAAVPTTQADYYVSKACSQ